MKQDTQAMHFDDRDLRMNNKDGNGAQAVLKKNYYGMLHKPDRLDWIMNRSRSEKSLQDNQFFLAQTTVMTKMS